QRELGKDVQAVGCTVAGCIKEYSTARSVGFHFPGLVEEARRSVTLPNHEQCRRSDGTQVVHADIRLRINGLLRTTSGRANRDGCSDRGHDGGTVADKQSGAIVTAIEGEVALSDRILKHLRKAMTPSIK